MTDDRWPQVKELFQAAVERPGDERDAFLAAATGDDEALRRDVESLLAADAADSGFLDQLPLVDESVVADPLAQPASTDDPQPHAVLGAGRGLDMETFLLQEAAHAFAYAFLIVDDQDTGESGEAEVLHGPTLFFGAAVTGLPTGRGAVRLCSLPFSAEGASTFWSLAVFPPVAPHSRRRSQAAAGVAG